MSEANARVHLSGSKGKLSARCSLTQIAADPRFLDASWLRERWTPRYILQKRIADFVIGVLFLVVGVLTFPFIAIAIKLDSRGPVFYLQERVGKGGVTFNIVKYRSMVRDAERDGARFAAHNDARVTRVGAFLRKTRLDELPQTFNVLRGQMTVVGPRPERPHVIELMASIEPAFRMRTVVHPGLTGHAQVNAHYAANNEQLLTKLEYDLYYIRNASLWFDLRIMVQTILVVFRRQGT